MYKSIICIESKSDSSSRPQTKLKCMSVIQDAIHMSDMENIDHDENLYSFINMAEPCFVGFVLAPPPPEVGERL